MDNHSTNRTHTQSSEDGRLQNNSGHTCANTATTELKKVEQQETMKNPQTRKRKHN